MSTNPSEEQDKLDAYTLADAARRIGVGGVVMGIKPQTRATQFTGRADELLVTRHASLDAAFLAHPNRFKNRKPQPHALPTAAWINPPPQEKHHAHDLQACTVNS